MMLKDHAVPAATVLRVRGHACLDAVCDTASFTVELTRSADSVGRARGKAQTAVRALDKLLTRFDADVVAAAHQPLRYTRDGDAVTVVAAVEVSVARDSVDALLASVHKLAPHQVSGLTWHLAADNQAYGFVRRAAVADAVAAARVAAEALRVELGTLTWMSADEPPRRADGAGNGPTTQVVADVLAQFTCTPPSF